MTKLHRRGSAIAKLGNDLISVGEDFADTNGIEQPRAVEWQRFLLDLDRPVNDLEPAGWKPTGPARRRGGSAVLGGHDDDLSRCWCSGTKKRCSTEGREPKKSLRKHNFG